MSTRPATRSSSSKSSSKAGPSKPPVLRKRDANRQTQTQTQLQFNTSTALSMMSGHAHTPAMPCASSACSTPAVRAPAAPAPTITTKNPKPDVIEVSDDEGDAPRAPRAKVAKAGMKRKEREVNNAHEKEMDKHDALICHMNEKRMQIESQRDWYKQKYEKVLEASARAAAERDDLSKKLVEAESSLKRKANVRLPDFSELDDTISCEICTNKMWQPATLRECGHTYCESCLHDWFNSTYTRHITDHPEFVAGPVIPPEWLVYRHLPEYAQAIENTCAEWRARVPQPVYTCPTCRGQVKSRPLEIFFVKEVVRKVARLMSRGGQRESSPAADRTARFVWDGFFPQ